MKAGLLEILECAPRRRDGPARARIRPLEPALGADCGEGDAELPHRPQRLPRRHGRRARAGVSPVVLSPRSGTLTLITRQRGIRTSAGGSLKISPATAGVLVGCAGAGWGSIAPTCGTVWNSGAITTPITR